MDDSTTGNTKQEMYTSGVASLIGVSSGISLDGESVRLPGDDGFEMNDDISSIHDGSSYYPNTSYYGSQAPPKIKIVGRVESMEEGTANINQLTPASIALSDQMRKADQRTKEEQEDKLSGTGGSNKTPPNMKKTSKIRIRNGNKKRNGCTPVWVQEAPLWLKVVIAISLALLVGAVVLVTLALSTALISQDKASTTLSSTSTPRPTDSGSTAQDPWAGVPDDNTWKGTPEPTEPLITKRPEEEEEGSSTSAPDTSAPESDETDTNQSESTTTPEDNTSPETTMPEPETFDSQVTTFFVTGGRFTNDALDQLPGQLATMPVRGGTSFMVHLGDWNSPYATKCDRQSYQDVNDLFSNSSIPVYFVPGDNEFNGK